MKPTWHQIAAVFGPIIVLAGWMAFHAFSGASGSTVRLPVKGVDPRDLLAGHYVIYRVDYGAAVDCATRDPEWCLCLDGKRDDLASATDQAACSDLRACSYRLKGSCEDGTFIAGIERYYFPEAYKNELAVVPPEASIVIALTAAGRATVKDLLVGDVPVLEWLATRR